MRDPVSALAADVQAHVPEQPWGRYGDRPVPLELWFDATYPAECWRVAFVTGVRHGRRSWGRATGPTVEAALTAARAIQMAGGS